MCILITVLVQMVNLNADDDLFNNKFELYP